MPTRDVTCCNCGIKGKLDVLGLKGDVPVSVLFRHLGHNPFSGYMQYRCPACKSVIDVDPMDVLGEGVVASLTHKSADTSVNIGDVNFLKRILSYHPEKG